MSDLDDFLKSMMMTGGPRPRPKPFPSSMVSRGGAGYINREGARISHEDWALHRLDSDYCTIKAYDNSEVCVSVEWYGKVEKINDSFPDMWKVFRLNVLNYNELGQAKPDPVENGRWFPTREKAIQAYENFLTGWTQSHRNEDGEFVEEDNSLTPEPPPPPPNPDAPDSDITTLKGFEDDDTGVW